MKRAIVVKGRVVGRQLIELEEPVDGVEAEVEVVLRERDAARADDESDEGESLVAVLHREDVEAAIAGNADLDVQVVFRQPPSPAAGSAEDVTESPLVVARRAPSSGHIRTPRS